MIVSWESFSHNFDMGSYVIGNAIALAAFASIVIFKKHATIGTHSLAFWVSIAMFFSPDVAPYCLGWCYSVVSVFPNVMKILLLDWKVMFVLPYLIDLL